MVKILPVICCEACDARLAEQISLNELRPLRADLQIKASRRYLHIRHEGCSGVTLWRIHADATTATVETMQAVG